MKKLLVAIALAMPLFATTNSNANEYDRNWRRPIDNILGYVADHSYTDKYCTSGTCSGSPDNAWSCGSQFGGNCDCTASGVTYRGNYTSNVPSNSCTYGDQAWEAYGNMWGYQCAAAITGKTYGSWGTCHQATGNMTWYILGGVGSLPNTIRAYSVSVSAYGNYGTDGGAVCN